MSLKSDHKFNSATSKCDKCGLDWSQYSSSWPYSDYCIDGEVTVNTVGDTYVQEYRTWKKGSGAVSTACLHVYVTYTGLREQFEYCKKCDQRRPQ